MNRTTRTIIATAAAVIALGLGAVTPAAAKAGDKVVTGRCSAASTYKFKVGPRDGGFEYEYEVDQNRNGRTWNVTVTDNGVQLFKGVKTTVAPSGSFSLSGRAANRAGTDAFVAKAVNQTTGETCTARISL